VKKDYIKAAYSDTDRIIDGERYIHWDCLSAYVNCARTGHLSAKTKHQQEQNGSYFEKFKRVSKDFFMGDWHKKLGYKGVDVMKLTIHPFMKEFEEELKRFNADKLDNITARRRKRRRIYTEDRGEYDYERGEETDFCMQDWKPRYVDAKAHGLIDIVCEFGGTKDLKNHQLENSGLAACEMADALETMGYSVRIVCVNLSKKLDVQQKTYDGTVCQSFIVKNYGESLSIGRVGLALATGQFYRTTGFAVKTKVCIGKAKRGLGRSAKCSLSHISNMSWGVSNNCIIFERMTDRDLAAAAVKKFIERKKQQANEKEKEVGYGYDKR